MLDLHKILPEPARILGDLAEIYSPRIHNLTVIAQGKIDECYNATVGFRGLDKTALAVFVITGDLCSMNQMLGARMPKDQTPKNQTPRQDLSRWVNVEAGGAAENLPPEVVSLDQVSTYAARV